MPGAAAAIIDAWAFPPKACDSGRGMLHGHRYEYLLDDEVRPPQTSPRASKLRSSAQDPAAPRSGRLQPNMREKSRGTCLVTCCVRILAPASWLPSIVETTPQVNSQAIALQRTAPSDQDAGNLTGNTGALFACLECPPDNAHAVADSVGFSSCTDRHGGNGIATRPVQRDHVRFLSSGAPCQTPC